MNRSNILNKGVDVFFLGGKGLVELPNWPKRIVPSPVAHPVAPGSASTVRSLPARRTSRAVSTFQALVSKKVPRYMIINDIL